MAIVLKYGSPGPILAAGYASGVGHRMHEQQDDALKVWQQNSQREFQAQQSWLDRYQQNNIQQNYFDQQNKQAAAQREFQTAQQQNAIGAQSTLAGRARQYNADQADKRLAVSVAEQQRREGVARAQANEDAVRKGMAVLPGAAQSQLDKLESAAVAVMKEDPAKQDEFFNKPGGYHDQKRQLYGMVTPVPGKSRDEQLQEFKNTLPEAERNKPWVLNSKGEGSLPPGWKPDTSVADAQKQRETDLKKYHGEELKMVDEKDPTKPKYANPDEAMKAAVARYDAFQRGLRGENPPPPPPAISAQDIATSSPQNLAAYNQMQDRMANYGVSAPRVSVPSAAQAAAPAAPSATVPAPPAAFAAGVAPPPVAAPQSVPQRPIVATSPAAPPPATQPATRPGTVFPIDNLPSNMQQIPQAQRQMFVENMPQHVNELPEELRQKYKTAWPRAATPEDAKKLAPGTIFIDANGAIRSVPF